MHRFSLTPLAWLWGGVALLMFTVGALASEPSNTVTSVLIGPLLTSLAPLVIGAISFVFMTIFYLVLGVMKTRVGVIANAAKIAETADARAAVNNACLNAAGRIMATQQSHFAHTAINVGNPLIAEELPKVMQYVAGQIQYLGWTPDHVADMILAKVGLKQTDALALPAPTPTPVPEEAK